MGVKMMGKRMAPDDLNMPYVCPKCGNYDGFYVSEVRIFDDIAVYQDGVDWWSLGHHSEIPDTATISCMECGAAGLVGEWIRRGHDEGSR